MVASTSGGDPGFGQLTQRCELVHRATDFETSSALHVLGLENNVAAGAIAQRGRCRDRRVLDHPGACGVGASDIGSRNLNGGHAWFTILRVLPILWGTYACAGGCQFERCRPRICG